MTAHKISFVTIGTGVLFGLITGCNNTDQKLKAEGATYLLKDEPSGMLSVLEAREMGEKEDVVVIGRVGSKSHQTWQPGKAAFMITDTSVEMGDHDHGEGDHSDCPYCQAKEGNGPDPSAVVQILDEDKNVLTKDAQNLLGLEEGQIIVVKGNTRFNEVLGLLYLDAAGIYIRE